MIEIKKTYVMGACAIVVVGGVVLHQWHHPAKRAGTPSHVVTATGTPIAPPKTAPQSTATTSPTITKTVTVIPPMSIPWQIAGIRSMEHHFDESGLGWQWIIPDGVPASYLFVNPTITPGQIQWGVEHGSQWTFGSTGWPTVGNSAPPLITSNPLTYAVSLMEPLMDGAGKTVSPTVAHAYQGSSPEWQLYQVQTHAQYHITTAGTGVTAIPGTGGVANITFQVMSPLPSGIFGPIYYNSQGQVVQDLVFQFHYTQGHWVWVGFQENPVASTQVSEFLTAPNVAIS